MSLSDVRDQNCARLVVPSKRDGSTKEHDDVDRAEDLFLARGMLIRLRMKPAHVIQILSGLFGGALIGGCASSGTEPNAMTAGQHQAAAANEEKTAAEHQGRYDPSGTEAPRAPSPGAYGACISYESSNCYVRWQSEENPTAQHRKDAEYHRKLADKHRAASEALRDAEQRFCAGIPEADRDLSPFYHREDITAVEGLKWETTSNGHSVYAPKVVQVQPIEKEVLGTDLLGARITFRAVRGMTGEWLQRVVDCHLARNAVVGAASDQTMSFCPLAVPHVTAKVTSTGTGFAVDVTSEIGDSALQVVKRARELAPTGPAVEK